MSASAHRDDDIARAVEAFGPLLVERSGADHAAIVGQRLREHEAHCTASRKGDLHALERRARVDEPDALALALAGPRETVAACEHLPRRWAR